MNQQSQSTKWSFAELSNVFDIVFEDLTIDIVTGNAPALNDEEMTEINLAWFEVLEEAGWTQRQWTRALNRAARRSALAVA